MTKNNPLTRIDLPQLNTTDSPQIQEKFYNPFTGAVFADNLFVEEISNIGVDINPKLVARINFILKSRKTDNIASTTFMPAIPRIYFNSLIPDFVYFTIQFSLTTDFAKYTSMDNVLIVSSATEKAPTFAPSVRLDKDEYANAIYNLLNQYTIEDFLEAYGLQAGDSISFFDKFVSFINNSKNTQIYIRLRLSNLESQLSNTATTTQFYYPKSSVSIPIQEVELFNTNISSFTVDAGFNKNGLKFSIKSSNIKSVKLRLHLPMFNLYLVAKVDNMINGVNTYSVKFKELFYSGGAFSTTADGIEFKTESENGASPFDVIKRYLNSSIRSVVNEMYLPYIYGTTVTLSIYEITLISGVVFQVTPANSSIFFLNETNPIITILGKTLPMGSQLTADSRRNYFIDTFTNTLHGSSQIIENADVDNTNVPENFLGVLALITVNSEATPSYAQFIPSDFLINKSSSEFLVNSGKSPYLKQLPISLAQITTGTISKINFYVMSYWGLFSKAPLTLAVAKQNLAVYSSTAQTLSVTVDKTSRLANIIIKKSILKSVLPTINGFLTITDAVGKPPVYTLPLQIARANNTKDTRLTLTYDPTAPLIRTSSISISDLGDSYSIKIKPQFMNKTYIFSMVVIPTTFSNYFVSTALNTPQTFVL